MSQLKEQSPKYFKSVFCLMGTLDLLYFLNILLYVLNALIVLPAASFIKDLPKKYLCYWISLKGSSFYAMTHNKCKTPEDLIKRQIKFNLFV